MNPFIIKDYAGPEHFCNRQSETDRIINAIENQRNLTLTSLRKMGKTGLIHHVFHYLGYKEKFDTIYLDVYFTQSLPEFINKLGTGLLQVKESFSERMKRRISDFMKSIRPVVTYDAYTGSPLFSFNIESEEAGIRTLDEIFGFLKERSREKPVVIAIDEFQQIARYPETNVEALLRSKIQQLVDVQFIFSGSDQQLLASMFADSRRPFYQSTQFMYLDVIPETEYVDFIRTRFDQGSISIENEAASEIMRLTRGHTYYVQFLCNRLYGSGHKAIGRDEVIQTLARILEENEMYYGGYRELLTKHQWNLLIALAKEDGIQQVTSGAFIRKHDLNNNATVRRGIESLLEKRVICKINKQYWVQDVFFAKWLQRL
jgi:uncharacterized protein